MTLLIMGTSSAGYTSGSGMAAKILTTDASLNRFDHVDIKEML
jgi:hypothetical protein